ncbi:hypothetical protein AAT19DRAFT_12275 [Rhodotorula toruloides]|uniref:Uncharacterized protein n=1 Tax=Rhodotorula toruloides TaxID=5286 RepID=A0A2T0AFT3_RHOTO|nr:hypothetical protein AAT19DRAFT_12275 [Rhodotorula toruloides]
MGEVALLQLAGGCRLAGGGQCGTGHCCTGAAQCPYGRLELCYSLVRSLRSLPSLPSTPLHTMAVRFFATSSHLRVHKRNIVWRSTVTFMEDKPLLLLPLSPPVTASSSPVPTRLPQLSSAAGGLPRLRVRWSASRITWRGGSEVGRHPRGRWGRRRPPPGWRFRVALRVEGRWVLSPFAGRETAGSSRPTAFRSS